MEAISTANDSTAIRRHIEQLYTTRRILGEDGVLCELDALSVTAERGDFIASVCREYRPAATLEVGMAWGMSTLFMLEALTEIGAARPGCHVVIDPFQPTRFHNAALQAVRDVGASDLIEFYPEPSQIVLPRLVSAKRSFDLAFIDGDHRFEAAFIDFYFIDQLLRPGGIVLFDDLGIDGVFLACNFAERSFGYVPKQEFSGKPRRRHRRDSRTGRYVRPAIRAYQKPLTPLVRDEFYVVPFWRNLVQFETVLGVVWPELARNRLNHIGRVALLEGDRATARRAFYQALRAGVWQPKTWLRLMRTFLPLNLARKTTGPKSHSHVRETNQ